MNKTFIICVGKLKDSFFVDASSEYEKRLSAFTSLETITIPQAALPNNPSEAQILAALDKEAEQIIKKIPQGAKVYPLCVEGVQMTSEGFAKDLQTSALNGFSSAVFIIGGSHGLSKKVKDLAHLKFSMSKMTFPHRLARIMLLEQIYRAFSILGGSKYHK